MEKMYLYTFKKESKKMLSLLNKIIGDSNTRHIKRYQKIVTKINALEKEYEQLTDEQLREKTSIFKQRLTNGEKIQDIAVEAFATVREASKRVLNMRHYDVQLIGGLVLTEANIAEMATGEGKTLVASLPSYLRALEGKGVHVITVNDYLARRDFETIGKIHEFLGLTVGLNLPMMQPEQKQRAYNSDITYGVGTEFGFDYLRDNMAQNQNSKVQRPYHYALIDEVDSVLIDEAKTPLIIAGKMATNGDLQKIAAIVAKRFVEDQDYEFDAETKTVTLTDEGISKIEKSFSVDNLYDLQHQLLYHYCIQAIRANVMFHRDVDYIVQDDKILLVDMFTGRVMEGRTLSDGLHQAIEAKEGVTLTEENKMQASITIQNYFRMYPYLAGMTGTAKTEEKEFLQVYNMHVITVPTNKPKRREDLPDNVYRTIDDKYKAVTKEVKERNKKGQPVLVGTTSILQSEALAKYFREAGLQFEILNAKTVEQEIQIISESGQYGHITIATNMAGRGTDIVLGEGVAELGGLCVIGTERHESRRIDNQLKGRSGRQGDPGVTKFYISLEDEMFKRFAKDDIEKLLPKLKIDQETGLITYKELPEFVDRIQRIVEGANWSMREYNINLDDVVNEQRNIVYTLRNRILNDEHLMNLAYANIQQVIAREVEKTCDKELLPEQWDLQPILSLFANMFHKESIEVLSDIQREEDLIELLMSEWEIFKTQLEATADQHEKYQLQLRGYMLSVLDHNWVLHLESMTRLKEGIGLRYYQQEDPMRIYSREGLELFTNFYHKVEKDIMLFTSNILKQILELEQQQAI